MAKIKVACFFLRHGVHRYSTVQPTKQAVHLICTREH